MLAFRLPMVESLDVIYVTFMAISASFWVIMASFFPMLLIVGVVARVSLKVNILLSVAFSLAL